MQTEFPGDAVRLADSSPPKTRCKRRPIEICGLLCCVLTTATQLVILDAYFVLYRHETAGRFFEGPDDDEANCSAIAELQQRHYSWDYLQYFAVLDVLTLAAMAYLPLAAILQTRRERARGFVKRHKVDASLRYAYVSWCVYAIDVIAKVAISSKSFLPVIQHLEGCDMHKVLGINVYIMALCGSCVVFFLIAFSHHAHQENMDTFLRELVEVVTFDVLDGVHFLQILFTQEGVEFMFLHHSLENAIIFFACVNFILPAISLLRLSRKLDGKHAVPTTEKTVTSNEHSFTNLNAMLDKNQLDDKSAFTEYPSNHHPAHVSKGPAAPFARMSTDAALKDVRSRSPTIARCCRRVLSDQYYSLPLMLLINLPYFVIRCYLWHVMKMEVSVFIVKNALAIVIELGKTVNNVRLALRH